MKTQTIFLDVSNLGNFFGSYQSFLMAFDKFLTSKGLMLNAYDGFIQVHDPKRETVIKTTVIKTTKIPVYKDRVVVKDLGLVSLEERKKQEEAMLYAYRKEWEKMPPKKQLVKEVVEKVRYVKVPNWDNRDTLKLHYKNIMDELHQTDEKGKQTKLMNDLLKGFNDLNRKLNTK